ncbi:GntR family transcriptional regulator [Phocaeicola sp.]
MKITFGQQTTKVKQLADLISQDISMGKYKSDCALPSINQLSRDYNVSRDTVFKAFIDLKDRGTIASTPGKGYYITNKLKNVLLLLDEYSPFKHSLYNSFVKNLSINYKVDLLFHQYNERLFNTIIRESIGRYNKYIVMNFDNEKFSTNLYKIEPSKLLLLDFGKFDKKDYSYVCQDFDDEFYRALEKLREQLRKYKRLVLLYPQESRHPASSLDHFVKFCHNNGLDSAIIDNMEEVAVRKGEAYIAFRQIDVVSIIKKSRIEKLECGNDFGLIAYNETPAYEVIDQGITALSIDWEQMGHLAAEFVLTGKEIKEYLPTELHLRKSL